MDSKVCVFLLALLGVAIALAGGSMEAAGLAGRGPYAAARQLMAVAPSTTRSMMGSEVHRRILGSISASYSSLDPNQAACLKSCPAAGRPYTGRGCLKVYQCRG